MKLSRNEGCYCFLSIWPYRSKRTEQFAFRAQIIPRIRLKMIRATLFPLSLPQHRPPLLRHPVYRTHQAYKHFVSLSFSLFYLLLLLLFSASKSAPARRTSLHTFILSTRVSILPSLPLPSPLSLSRALSLLSLRSRSMGRGPIRTHVALVGKIEATERDTHRVRALWASRRRLSFASTFETSPRDNEPGAACERRAPFVVHVAGYHERFS